MKLHRLHNGIVALVGAGPGDPGLITVKGRDYLQQADTVIYDHLVPEELLDYTPSHTELLYVGKKSGKHTKTQDQINHLLVQHARVNKKVVRLKGGDPFIFGRGAEECLHLSAHGIAFEVVPGISATAAVPAYAGIPLTARDISPSFIAVTGHEHACKNKTDVDWKTIAALKTTLVIFMGIFSIRHICSQLLQYGLDQETPAAVIRWGTVPDKQQVVTGTVQTIADKVEQNNLRPPGLIVIGEVVRYHDQLQWFHQTLATAQIAQTEP